MERVVLNALGDITAASPPDICAFGGEFTSSSEKPIHLRLIVALRRFARMFFTFAVIP